MIKILRFFILIWAVDASAYDAKPTMRWFSDGKGCSLWQSTQNDPISVKWDGACRKGHFDGKGTYVLSYPSGQSETFTGVLKNGVETGIARVVFETNKGKIVINGLYVDGVMNGDGKVEFSSGAVYSGHLFKNTMEGEGVLTRPDGSVYTGSFHDNRFSGNGRLCQANGQCLTAMFVNGAPDGIAEIMDSKSGTRKAEFKDGIRVPDLQASFNQMAAGDTDSEGHNKCVSFGLQRGTSAYADCRMKLMERAENIRVAEEQKREMSARRDAICDRAYKAGMLLGSGGGGGFGAAMGSANQAYSDCMIRLQGR